MSLFSISSLLFLLFLPLLLLLRRRRHIPPNCSLPPLVPPPPTTAASPLLSTLVALIPPLASILDLRKLLQASARHQLPQHLLTRYPQSGSGGGGVSGGTFRTTSPLGYPGIDTFNPVVVQAVIATHFDSFGVAPVRHAAFEPLIGDSLLTVDGVLWKGARSALRGQFAGVGLGAGGEQTEMHVQSLLKALRSGGDGEGKEEEEERSVEVMKLFLEFTMRSGLAWLFGSTPEEEEKEEQRRKGGGGDDDDDDKMMFAKAFEICQGVVTWRITLGGIGTWLLKGPSEYARGLQACRSCRNSVGVYVDSTLAELTATAAAAAAATKSQSESDADAGVGDTRKGSGGKYSFLTELAKTTDDRTFMIDQALTMMAAARDTTAMLLTWTIHQLSRNPRVWKQLREDIVTRLGEGPDATLPTYHDITELTYLRYVLKEVLRLYPPLFLNGRMALRDTVLPVGGGADGKSPMFIAKGDTVQYSVFVMHRRRELYGDDAAIFRPERWGENNAHLGRTIGFGYLPFNGGPRICLGQKRALNEASYVMIRLVQSVREITAVGKHAHEDGEDIQYGGGLTLAPLDGVEVRVKCV